VLGRKRKYVILLLKGKQPNILSSLGGSRNALGGGEGGRALFMQLNVEKGHRAPWDLHGIGSKLRTIWGVYLQKGGSAHALNSFNQRPFQERNLYKVRGNGWGPKGTRKKKGGVFEDGSQQGKKGCNL